MEVIQVSEIMYVFSRSYNVSLELVEIIRVFMFISYSISFHWEQNNSILACNSSADVRWRILTQNQDKLQALRKRRSSTLLDCEIITTIQISRRQHHFVVHWCIQRGSHCWPLLLIFINMLMAYLVFSKDIALNLINV